MSRNRQQAFAGIAGGDKAGADDPANNAEGSQAAADGAEGDNGGDSAAEGGAASQTASKKPDEPEKKYTDDDVDRIVDRIIAKERAKADKEKDAITEAQKLEQMNAQERAEYQNKKLQEEVDALKREKNLNEQMAVARKELKDAGINVSDKLLSMVVSPDAETTKANVSEFKETWAADLEAAVKESLKRNPPQAEKPNQQGKSRAAAFATDYSNQMNGGKKNALQ